MTDYSYYISRKQLKQTNKQKNKPKRLPKVWANPTQKGRKASKNSAAKTANRCAKDLAVVWIGERHNTQHTERAQVGQKADARAEISLAPTLPGRRRGAEREPGRPIPVDSPFRRNFMSGALTVVCQVCTSRISVQGRSVCFEGGGKEGGGLPGLSGDMFFDRDGFSFFLCSFALYLFQVFITQKKKIWNFG